MIPTRGGWVFVGLPLLACLCGHVCAAAEPAPARAPNVRSANKQILALLSEGSRRSLTFRALVAHIERSDLVVYVDPVSSMPPGVSAYLQWGAASATQRFVRVAVKFPNTTDKLLMLIGHELQHATEVADAPEVRDEASMSALYRRIGDVSDAPPAPCAPGHTPTTWDSAAARWVGNVIRDELNARTKPAAPVNAAPAVPDNLVSVRPSKTG